MLSPFLKTWGIQFFPVQESKNLLIRPPDVAALISHARTTWFNVFIGRFQDTSKDYCPLSQSLMSFKRLRDDPHGTPTSSLPHSDIQLSTFNSACSSSDSAPVLLSSFSLSLLSLLQCPSLFLWSWSRDLLVPDSRLGEERLGPVNKLTVIGDTAVQHFMLTVTCILWMGGEG